MAHIRRIDEMGRPARRNGLGGADADRRMSFDGVMKMNPDEFTAYMRRAGVMGENDYVDYFSYPRLSEMIEDAVKKGYKVSVRGLDKAHCAYAYVRFLESRYGNACTIETISDAGWRELPFDYDKIIRDMF